MAALPTIPETILIGQSSISLADNDYTGGAVWGARKTKATTSVLIAYTTDALLWGYEANPANSTLRGTANYDIWLCGTFGQQARSGSGGGSVVPIPPGITTPGRIDFYATDSTFLVTGQSSATITQWIGYKLIFVRGNLDQGMANNGTDSYFTWNTVTGAFFCYGAINEGEPISLIPYL